MPTHVLVPRQSSAMSSARGPQPGLPTSAPANFQVGPGTMVTLQYEVFDEDGELIDASGTGGIEAVFGCGQLLPQLEQAIQGLMPGDRRTIELPPVEGYGEWDQAAVLEVDPSEFPPETKAGDEFEAENPEGAVLLFKVLDVTPDAVLLDTNHPLAGQRVRFALEVQAVRPATEEELEAAANRALESTEQLEPSQMLPTDLVAPGRLLPGGKRR